jgi:hypothetical protein
MDYRVFDIETSTKTEYKRKANPFSPDNYMVSYAAAHGKLTDPYDKQRGSRVFGHYLPKGLTDRDERIAACKKPGVTWFSDMLSGVKILVGANIKFDILYALANPNCNHEFNLRKWMEFVKRGGIVWDIQLAEYLLQGMETSSHMLPLNDMAPEYGGNVKLDEVKLLWDAGVDTIDIPEDLLMRYLCGYEEEGKWEHGDIGNTELVFRGQYAAAKANGQLRSLLLNMGSLMFTIECERNGMFVNQPLANELAAKTADKLATALVEVNGFIPADLPAKLEFNWNSRFHKSALIFGGPVKYRDDAPVLDDEGNLTYYQCKQTHYLLTDGSTQECVSYDIQVQRCDTVPLQVLFAGGKNKGQPKTKQVTVPDIKRGPKTRQEDFFYEFPGFTKPNAKWKSAEDGVYSTAAEVIDALGNRDIPFLQALKQVQSLTKDLGTYFIRYDEKKKQNVGMLTMVQLDSIVHHMLNHTNTVTGRLSSSNPNLQNLSKGQKSDVKMIFESRHGENGVIIQSDFSSLEVYVQAILTKAEKLIEDLKSGIDMHCMRLAAKESMEYERVFELCKIIADADWDYKRTKSKEFSFQRAYGAGVAAICESTGMSEDDVKALIAAEEARYPEIKQYFEARATLIKQGRVPIGLTVQHPDIPGLTVQLGKSYSTTPDGKLYCYKEQCAPKFMAEKGTPRSFKPTEIKNYEVQGTGGEIAKAAMWLSLRAFYHYDNFNGRALLVNQVHDAEYVDAHNDVKLKAAALLHAVMEEASNFFSWWFNWKLPLPVPSDTVWGKNMGTEDKITDPNFAKAVAALKPWLRKQFMNGYTPSFTH